MGPYMGPYFGPYLGSYFPFVGCLFFLTSAFLISCRSGVVTVQRCNQPGLQAFVHGEWKPVNPPPGTYPRATHTGKIGPKIGPKPGLNPEIPKIDDY